MGEVIYLADMRSIPNTALSFHREFVLATFQVKRTKSQFCQIGIDQALVHINRVARVCGGIVSITRNQLARDRWCLTLNQKAAL